MTFEEDDFQEIVAKHFPHANLIESCRLTGGVSADVFKLVIEHKSGHDVVVLRVHGDNHSGHPALLEYELLNSLLNANVLVAAAIAVDVSRKEIPADYLLLGYVQGGTTIRKGFAPTAIRQMAHALYHVHNEQIEGLPQLPLRLEPLPELFDYLPEGIEWQRIRESLGTIESTFTGTPRLLHGDFWPENIMWREERIVAILDWEDAAIGDPLADVAGCFSELRYVHGLRGSELFLKEYIELNGPLDLRRLALWKIYVSAAAQKYMSCWGLSADKEAHMRKTAGTNLREAVEYLLEHKVSKGNLSYV